MKNFKKEIPFGRPWLDDEDRQAVMNVLQGHVLTHGPKCHEFEEAFSKFMGSGYSVTTSSCMASLHLSAIELGLKPDDEVLVPAQTHVATVHAIELVGAIPVFVDCEMKTGNIDIDSIESKINSKTKAIFVVHFAGIPAQMDRICQIAEKNQLHVVEDCALAIGGTFKGKHVGLWGDLGCFSFYPVKHMTTAEGGMIVSKNETLIRKIALFRAFNVDRSFNDRKIPGIYDVIGVGLNYRMSELQAALGCTQVKKMPRNLEIRKKNFSTLKERLISVKGISHVLDSQNADSVNSHYCLVVILENHLHKLRNDILLQLTERGIGCSVYYPQPVPRMKYYNEKYQTDPNTYLNAIKISDGSISLPVGPHLDNEDMKIIAMTLKNILKELE